MYDEQFFILLEFIALIRVSIDFLNIFHSFLFFLFCKFLVKDQYFLLARMKEFK